MRVTEKQVWLALVWYCNAKGWTAIDVPREIREEFERDHAGERSVRVSFARAGGASGLGLTHNAWGWSLEKYARGSTGVSRVSHFEGCTAREMWERLWGAQTLAALEM